MIGAPATSINCFGICPPNLLPLPAAGMMAMFITVVGGWWLVVGAWLRRCQPGANHQPPTTISINRRGRHGRGSGRPVAVSVPRIAQLRLLVLNAPEDHLARRGLQHAGHDHVNVLAD